MDSVTAYLSSKGLVPRTEYWGESDFVLGQRIDSNGMRLVYRLEDDDSLIICDFGVDAKASGPIRPMKTFLKLMRSIVADVAEVQCVRGLLVPTLTNSAHNARRARLAEVLIDQGAGLKKYGDDTWFVFPAPAGEVPA